MIAPRITYLPLFLFSKRRPLKGKNLLLSGANCFLLEDPFSDGIHNFLTELPLLKVCRFLLTIAGVQLIRKARLQDGMCVQRTLRSACAFAQSDQSFRRALCGLPMIQSIIKPTAKTDQTALMHRLILVFTGRTFSLVGNAVLRLIYTRVD